MDEIKEFSCPPPKVLLMYEAVVEMIGEGYDVNKMKVSDITARAGIGKGTAYEYFSSKEEIITRAIAYDVWKKREYLRSLVKGVGNFKEKFDKMLDYLIDSYGERETFCLLVRIGTGSYEISEPLRKEYEKMQQSMDCESMEKIVDMLMQQGVEEGVIKDRNLDRQRMAFVAQIVGFATYLVGKSKGKEIPTPVEQAREFAYESLVKSLN